MAGETDRRRDATAATRAANEAMAAGLPFEDRRDFDEAARGLVAPLPDGGVVRDSAGGPLWDLSRFDFIHGDAPAPDTVNSWTLLLRNGALTHRRGLVVDAGATLTLNRTDLDAIVLRTTTLPQLLESRAATLDGDADAVHELLGLLDDFEALVRRRHPMTR